MPRCMHLCLPPPLADEMSERHLIAGLIIAGLVHAAAQSSPQFTFVQRHARAQCRSNDLYLKTASNAQACAAACAAESDCRFFTFTSSGDCHQELTLSATCPEGWDNDDSITFYELQAIWMGCMEPRAANYNSQATIDNGSCAESDACVSRSSSGVCDTCRELRHGCDVGNHGYRHPFFDTVQAQYLGEHLPRSASRAGHGHAKVIDGDLSDWRDHDPLLVYQDVGFAKADGEEVVFESSMASGQWFGLSDFSATWMLAWNDAWLYMALDVRDDKTFAGMQPPDPSQCWAFHTGLQLAFEVGGPSAAVPDVVQARWSSPPLLLLARPLLLSLPS